MSAIVPKSTTWPYPRILAHRGGGVLAPENTLAAMRCGLAHGFHAVEFDVMLTSDQTPVLMHDPEFGRTVRAPGSVPATTASALLAMDAGAWFCEAFRGERVPGFEQVVAFCRANGIWMNIEIKPAPGFEAITGRIVAEATRTLFADQIAAHGARHAALPLLSSFSREALHAARAAAPELALGCLFDRIPDDWRALLAEVDAAALHTNHKHLQAQQAQDVKRAGYGLFCYTVNEVARARELFDWGVDGFCTDRIDLIDPVFA